MSSWIKMRKKLLTDPRVVRMASALDADRLRIIGGLFAVWSSADDHGERFNGLTISDVSTLIGWPGFAEAMPPDWIESDANGITFPSYEIHNGSTAKRRAQDSVRKTSARDADKKRTREEKRREEVTTSPQPEAAEATKKRVTHWADPQAAILCKLDGANSRGVYSFLGKLAQERTRLVVQSVLGRMPEFASWNHACGWLTEACRTAKSGVAAGRNFLDADNEKEKAKYGNR